MPQTRDPEAIPETSRQILLEVQADGGVSVAGRRVSTEELRQTLADLYLADPTRLVIVKADRSLPYRHVVAVLRIASEAKIDRAGLITERRGAPGA